MLNKNHKELKELLRKGGCWALALMPYLPVPTELTPREQYRHLTRNRKFNFSISIDRALIVICLLMLTALLAKAQTPQARATAAAPVYVENQVVPLSVDLAGTLRTTAGGGGGGGLTDAQLRASPVPMSLATAPLPAGASTEATLASILARLPALVTGRIPVDGSGVTQPVSGTFWQATQPISGTVSVSGSVAVTGPLTDVQLRAAAVPVSGTFWQATQPVSGTFWQATQPVSGPLTDAQIRATALPVSGTFFQATQPVSIAANVNENLAQIGATTVVNGGLAGTLAIGGTAATNASITQNPLLIGAEALSSQPVAATTGNQRRLVSSLDGGLYVRSGGPVTFTCGLNSIAATLTQCQAAPGAGLSLYITSIAVQTTTATSGTYAFQQGTGVNCATGTAGVFPVSATANRFNAPIAANAMANIEFPVPLKLTAASALCMIGVATNTISAQVVGFTAP